MTCPCNLGPKLKEKLGVHFYPFHIIWRSGQRAAGRFGFGDPDVVQREGDDLMRRQSDAEAWAKSFQKPVRDCYAQLGIDFSGLSPVTLEEQESLLEGAYDEKYAGWLELS